MKIQPLYSDQLVAVTLRIPGRVIAQGKDVCDVETDHGLLRSIPLSWVTSPCPPTVRPASFQPAMAMAHVIAAQAAEGHTTTEGDLMRQNFTPREIMTHFESAQALAETIAASAAA